MPETTQASSPSDKSNPTNTRSRRLIIGLSLTALCLILTVVSIVLTERDTSCGYLTMEGHCNGTAIRFCDKSIGVYLDKDAGDLVEATQTCLDMYSPHMGSAFHPPTILSPTSLPMASSIMIHRSNPGDLEGESASAWDEEGCIIVNDVYISTSLEETQETMVLCHEIGHSLGLAHPTKGWSIMHDPPGGLKPSLTEKEKGVLGTLYK